MGNLPYQISQSAVLDIFKPVGRSGIIRISVKAGKGFAHVEFSQTVSMPFLDDPDTTVLPRTWPLTVCCCVDSVVRGQGFRAAPGHQVHGASDPA